MVLRRLMRTSNVHQNVLQECITRSSERWVVVENPWSLAENGGRRKFLLGKFYNWPELKASTKWWFRYMLEAFRSNIRMFAKFIISIKEGFTLHEFREFSGHFTRHLHRNKLVGNSVVSIIIENNGDARKFASSPLIYSFRNWLRCNYYITDYINYL